MVPGCILRVLVSVIAVVASGVVVSCVVVPGAFIVRLVCLVGYLAEVDDVTDWPVVGLVNKSVDSNAIVRLELVVLDLGVYLGM